MTRGGTLRPFATTRWSVVLAAGAGESPDAREALDVLCESYWFPLYAYARRGGHGEEDARDLVQGFLARLVERGTVAAADPERGRFRTFLLTAFRNFIVDEWRHGRTDRRGGARRAIPLEDAEGRLRHEPATTETPERRFERDWALAVLDRALSRLRRRYEETGKTEVFETLKGALDGSDAEGSHSDRAAHLGITEGAVRVAAHRLRQRYRETLREEVAQTLAGEETIEDEIRALFSALEMQ